MSSATRRRFPAFLLSPVLLVAAWAGQDAEVAEPDEVVPPSVHYVALHVVTGVQPPDAEAIVTGYLPIVAAGGGCPELGVVSPADRDWAVGLTADINDTVRAATEDNGAVFVLPGNAEEHTVCAPPEQRWVDITGAQADVYPMHPTSAGQEAVAAAVDEAR